jgi:ABC-type sugar transport system substrate-binding protein
MEQISSQLGIRAFARVWAGLRRLICDGASDSFESFRTTKEEYMIRVIVGAMGRRSNSRLTAALVLAVALPLAACSSGSSTGAAESAAAESAVAEAAPAPSCEKNYTIAFSHIVSEAVVVKAVRSFADQRAAELGCITMLHDNTTGGNLEQQTAALETWINQGVDAIVLLPVDAASVAPYKKRADAAGIAMSTYAFPIEGYCGNAGFDATQSGELIADAAIEWAKTAYPNGGAKALVSSLSALPLLAPRWEVPVKKLKDAGIEVVAVQDGADIASGLEITETTLQAHPDLSIVIGLNDDFAVGAYQAFENAKIDPEKVFIGGQDGSLEGMEAIKEGKHYKASSAILLDQLGASIVDISLACITGKGETNIATPAKLVTLTEGGLDEMIASFKSLG